uniref:Uncharacterized protein n=1 Tax=Phalansterium sp. PJK-2012 TaxID=1267188 RepID=T1QE54_9EUKA|nr:hypothetical protein [Phalansterium sp. PJK-2012]
MKYTLDSMSWHDLRLTGKYVSIATNLSGRPVHMSTNVGYAVTGPTNGMFMIVDKQLCYPLSINSPNGSKMLDAIRMRLLNSGGSLVYPGSDGSHVELIPNTNLGMIFTMKMVGINRRGVQEKYYFDPCVSNNLIPFSQLSKRTFMLNAEVYACPFGNDKAIVLAQHKVKIDGVANPENYGFSVWKCKIDIAKNYIYNFSRAQPVFKIEKLLKDKFGQNFQSDFDFKDVEDLFLN